MKRFSVLLLIAVLAMLASAALVSAQGQEKKDVCHWDGSTYILINIADPAWPAHEEHGDYMAGGFVLDENCQPYNYSPAKTGQDRCWQGVDPYAETPCSDTGQDGEHQYGSEPVAEPVKGHSFGGYDRTTILAGASDPGFTDNEDGTVTDNLTGLMWLQDASQIGTRDWQGALTEANNLTYAGKDDWRLPNINELRSLFDRNQGSSNQYLPDGHPFAGVSSYYWSSTSDAFYPVYAWHVNLGVGFVGSNFKGYRYNVWPVRGGQ